jgi:hypothetical protein
MKFDTPQYFANLFCPITYFKKKHPILYKNRLVLKTLKASANKITPINFRITFKPIFPSNFSMG